MRESNAALGIEHVLEDMDGVLHPGNDDGRVVGEGEGEGEAREQE